MRRLLICPSERSPVPFLSQTQPLASLPLLGQSLLEYWLSALAMKGVTDVSILAHDRPELVQELVGGGERWGLQAIVQKESRELTPAEAFLKHAEFLGAAADPHAIAVLDRFPGRPEQSLFANYQTWFADLCRWMPSALTPDRVGINETSPGVWKGCRSHVSPLAQLHGPCWIGQHVFVGAKAIVGPGAVLEDGAFLEPGAEVAHSWIGPDTFVGQFARIHNSLAWAGTLLDWRTGSAVQLTDPFLLSAVRQPRRHRTLGWLKKLSGLYARNKAEVGLLWKHLLIHRQG